MSKKTGIGKIPQSYEFEVLGTISATNVIASSLSATTISAGNYLGLTSASIPSFTENIQDTLVELLSAGSNIQLVYDDNNNKLLISASGGSTGTTIPSSVSAVWQNTSTTVSSNSADWESVYFTVNTTSATWLSGGHNHDDRYFTETELSNFSQTLSLRNAYSPLVCATNVSAISLRTSAINVDGNIYITGTVDGRDIYVDGSTLDAHVISASVHFTDASILHNNRSDLQGGITNQYYHLNLGQHGYLTSGGSGSSLHTHDDRYLTETELGNFSQTLNLNTLNSTIISATTYNNIVITSASITNFKENIYDAIIELLSAGSNIRLTYDDNNDKLEISASGGSGTSFYLPPSLSANWNNVYTTVNTYSADWNNVVTSSDEWNTVYTNVNTSANIWNSTKSNLENHLLSASVHFTDASVSHNNRSDLQGGTTNQYYHLSFNEHGYLTSGSNASSLHIHDDRYFTETELTNFSQTLSLNTLNSTTVSAGTYQNITSASIGNFKENVQDAVIELLSAGNNIRITYDDINNKIEISSSDLVTHIPTSISAVWQNTSTSVSTNSADWNTAYASINTSAGNWNTAYINLNTSANTWNTLNTNVNTSAFNWNGAYQHISNNGTDHSYINQNVTTTGTPRFSSVSATNISADTYIGITSASISNFVENVYDIIHNLLSAGSNIQLVYDDNNNKLMISASGGSSGSGTFIPTSVSAVWENTATTVSTNSADWNLNYFDDLGSGRLKLKTAYTRLAINNMHTGDALYYPLINLSGATTDDVGVYVDLPSGTNPLFYGKGSLRGIYVQAGTNAGDYALAIYNRDVNKRPLYVRGDGLVSFGHDNTGIGGYNFPTTSGSVNNILTQRENGNLTFSDSITVSTISATTYQNITSASITEFKENVFDSVLELLSAGSNIQLVYDDNNNKLMISASGGSTGSGTFIPSSVSAVWQNTSTTVSTNSADWESVYSTVNTTSATWLSSGHNHDDRYFTETELGNFSQALSLNTLNSTTISAGTYQNITSASISNFVENVQDITGLMISAGTNVGVSYDDNNSKVSVSAEGFTLQTCDIGIIDTSPIDISNAVPHYSTFAVSKTCTITKATFAVLSYAAPSSFDVGIYNWALSGSVTKRVSTSASVTGAGVYTVTFSTPVTLDANTFYLGALVKSNASANLVAARTGVSSNSAIHFQGATNGSLPATESTRSASSRCIWLWFS